jgi:hypothetical protein
MDQGVLIRVIALTKIEAICFAFTQFSKDWRPRGIEPISQIGSCQAIRGLYKAFERNIRQRGFG